MTPLSFGLWLAGANAGPRTTQTAAQDRGHERRTRHGADGARLRSALSDRDLEILAFERQWWKYAGSKEQAIKELFDMSSTRYYQVLNALLDTPPPSRPTRCSSSGCAGCAPAASGPARAAASASTSERYAPIVPLISVGAWIHFAHGRGGDPPRGSR